MHPSTTAHSLANNASQAWRGFHRCFAVFPLIFQDVLDVAVSALPRDSEDNFVGRFSFRTDLINDLRFFAYLSSRVSVFVEFEIALLLCSLTGVVKRWPNSELSSKPSIAARSSISDLEVQAWLLDSRGSWRDPTNCRHWPSPLLRSAQFKIAESSELQYAHRLETKPNKEKRRNVNNSNIVQLSTVVTSCNGSSRTREQRHLGERMVQPMSCGCRCDDVHQMALTIRMATVQKTKKKHTSPPWSHSQRSRYSVHFDAFVSSVRSRPRPRVSKLASQRAYQEKVPHCCSRHPCTCKARREESRCDNKPSQSPPPPSVVSHHRRSSSGSSLNFVVVH